MHDDSCNLMRPDFAAGEACCVYPSCGLCGVNGTKSRKCGVEGEMRGMWGRKNFLIYTLRIAFGRLREYKECLWRKQYLCWYNKFNVSDTTSNYIQNQVK